LITLEIHIQCLIFAEDLNKSMKTKESLEGQRMSTMNPIDQPRSGSACTFAQPYYKIK